MRRTVFLSTLVVSSLFFAAPAFAADADEAPSTSEPPPPKPQHAVSLTFSPLHLIFPELKGMVEVKIDPKFSVAVLGGIGSIKVDSTVTGPYGTTSSSDRFTVWELGGQATYYPVGDFEHGMQLGAQVEYLKVALDNGANATVLGSGSGVAMGPFIGYKLATRVGFTLDLQGGVAYVAAKADASSTDGSSAHKEGSSVVPLVNLHIGWSF